MPLKTVTEAGFYGGKFLKPGQTYGSDEVEEKKLDRMNKDELLAEATARNVEVDPSKTKAEIIFAIEAAGDS
ncbi:hypothetical protein MRBLMR1_004867 [Neorhizobium sp. LMR1-1-1.1]